MNVYAVVIAGSLVGEWLLGLIADIVNLRALDPQLPAELDGVYDAERYRRSQQYTRARTRFALVPTTFHLVVFGAFWAAGGFGWLDGAARGLELGPVATGLVFIGGLVLGRVVLGLPFAWYSTFVIEERFGFNRTTPRTFWADRLKGVLLMALLGGGMLAGVLWFFDSAGPDAWLWCWLAATLFTLGLQYVAPTWIMPLFNRFTQLEDDALRQPLRNEQRSTPGRDSDIDSPPAPPRRGVPQGEAYPVSEPGRASSRSFVVSQTSQLEEIQEGHDHGCRRPVSLTLPLLSSDRVRLRVYPGNERTVYSRTCAELSSRSAARQRTLNVCELRRPCSLSRWFVGCRIQCVAS